jgi:hypothetical protein
MLLRMMAAFPRGKGREGEKLYLIEEEWLERYKQNEPECSRHGSGSSSHNKGRDGKNKFISSHDLSTD